MGRTSEKEVTFHCIIEADIKAEMLLSDESVIGKIANKARHKTLSAREYEK